MNTNDTAANFGSPTLRSVASALTVWVAIIGFIAII